MSNRREKILRHIAIGESDLSITIRDADWEWEISPEGHILKAKLKKKYPCSQCAEVDNGCQFKDRLPEKCQFFKCKNCQGRGYTTHVADDGDRSWNEDVDCQECLDFKEE